MKEIKTFIETLHHNDHNSFYCYLAKDQNSNVNHFFSKEIPKINQNKNMYVSLNGYTRKKRNQKSLREINAIYIDLDFHIDFESCEYKQAENEMNWYYKAQEKTLELIKQLPIYPTMITDTGRGLGVYYVFTRSIANTKKTKKSIRLAKFVWNRYARILQEYINEEFSTWNQYNLPNVFEVDFSSVGDFSRVVRIAGSTNLNNQSKCKIIHKGDYVDLSLMASTIEDYKKYLKNKGNKTNDYKRKIKKNKQRAKYNQIYMCRAVIDILEELQRNYYNHDGRHHKMCFLYYNFAKQISSNAEQETIEFNHNFPDRSEELSSLRAMFRSVNRASSKYGSGFYAFTYQTLLDELALDRHEKKYYINKIKEKRNCYRKNKTKEEKKEIKKVRDEKVCMDISEGIYTYKEIAERNQVSLSTVNRIAKKYNLTRGRNWITEDSEWVDKRTRLARQQKRIQNIKKAKSCSHYKAVLLLEKELEDDCKKLNYYKKWYQQTKDIITTLRNRNKEAGRDEWHKLEHIRQEYNQYRRGVLFYENQLSYYGDKILIAL